MAGTTSTQTRTVAHVAPLFVFLLFLVVPDIMSAVGIDASAEDAPWYVSRPQQWLYPLQSLTCLALLWLYRRNYCFRPHTGWLLAVVTGVLGIVTWIGPGWLFRTCELSDGWWKFAGFAARTEGFDPTFIKADSAAWYWLAVGTRFLRLVVVVPLVEEIFWRGFLMRYLVDLDGDYWQVPFGTWHRRSLIVVTAMFVLVHSPVDYLAATVFGLLAYWLAVKTKSLSACIVMHATANLILGLYVMRTGQWGYW